MKLPEYIELKVIKIQKIKNNKKYLFFRHLKFLFNKTITKKNIDDKLKTKSGKKGPVTSNRGNKIIGNLEIKTFSI